MRILALEIERPGLSSEAFAPHLEDEARALWALYRSGIERASYFRQHRHTAVLMLECESITPAQQLLSALPLVQRQLIHFELIPLEPYTGYSRLFRQPP